MSVNYWISLFSCFLLAFFLWAFGPQEDDYAFPIKSHRALSGTFGELRPDHFHSGIDIKTGGRSGAPLYAIDDAYVYRIKVHPYGFGKAIYLRHEDGRFSVYGHMSRFIDKFEDYAYERQMTSKEYTQEIYLSRNELRVEKGELIGYSGNSGSSFGPHLHFEIRDPEEKIMNPLAWYKGNIADTKKPIVQNIAFEPIDVDSRVRGEFRKYVLTPEGSNGTYRLPSTILVKGRFGIEYRAYDLLNAAANHCGINEATLFLDGEKIYEFDLTKYAFDEKRYINLHIDYQYYQQKKQRFEKAYQDFGNKFPACTFAVDRGMIELSDDQVHEFRLVLKDLHGNTTSVNGKVKRDPKEELADKPSFYQSPRLVHEVKRNILRITANQAHKSYEDGLIYDNQYGESKRIMPAYTKGNKMIFLLPLSRYDYPKRVRDDIGKYELNLGYQEEILPNKNNLVRHEGIQLFFPYDAVFEPVHLEVNKKAGNSRMYSDIFEVGDREIPLFKSYLVSFKVGEEVDRSHLVVAHKVKGKWKFLGNTMGEDNNVFASTREFGSFCLMADSTAPEIAPVNFNNGSSIPRSQQNLVLRVNDSFSGIKHDEIYCTLDGEWMLFEYNFKRNTITHSFRRKRPAPGTYTLRVQVEDDARNMQSKEYKLRIL